MTSDTRSSSVPSPSCIGNETHGLSMNYAKVCDAMIRIPMQGSVSSLNVASAATILLYEIERQTSRRATLEIHYRRIAATKREEYPLALKGLQP